MEYIIIYNIVLYNVLPHCSGDAAVCPPTCLQAELQMWCLQLLVCLCHTSQAVSEQLAGVGTFQNLLTLLPSPPAPAPAPVAASPVPAAAAPSPLPMQLAAGQGQQGEGGAAEGEGEGEGHPAAQAAWRTGVPEVSHPHAISLTHKITEKCMPKCHGVLGDSMRPFLCLLYCLRHA